MPWKIDMAPIIPKLSEIAELLAFRNYSRLLLLESWVIPLNYLLPFCFAFAFRILSSSAMPNFPATLQNPIPIQFSYLIPSFFLPDLHPLPSILRPHTIGRDRNSLLSTSFCKSAWIFFFSVRNRRIVRKIPIFEIAYFAHCKCRLVSRDFNFFTFSTISSRKSTISQFYPTKNPKFLGYPTNLPQCASRALMISIP